MLAHSGGEPLPGKEKKESALCPGRLGAPLRPTFPVSSHNCSRSAGSLEGCSHMSDSKVLIVDDDPHIAEILTLHLQDAGFSVTHVADGERGLQRALANTYDLVILDVMLPGRDGIEICRELRSKKVSARIMMLTFRGEEIDKILGLELGADDYVTKPFSVREVVARAKALIRRTSGEVATRDQTVSLGALLIDPSTREVVIDGHKIELTSTEFDLLLYMAKHPGRAFTREQLLNAVWGYTSSAYEHTVNTHINRLRSKLEQDPANPKFIQTVWGVGYKCVGESRAVASGT
jgi:two-component system alkaline phosphatase synthesis response regulator PhoP